jgi:hypothetical protein
VQKWIVEQDSAKFDYCKPRWMKPKMLMMENAICKPVMADFTTVDQRDREDEEEDNLAQLSNISNQ